jgi:ABC-type multidrug transport system ATPase subunit
MGPSGSGKTSLLNVLAGRQSLSRGSKFDGTISVNGRRVDRTDFGKFGAFVQQDDVLIQTMTPRECFEFAIMMTSSLSRYEAQERVERMLDRLGIQSCSNTIIGGAMVKGVSGGERKRTSIGYELITNPSLLLLDEPTSGLDSHTALSIAKLIKQEAKRGMSMLATIHLPSSEIFHTFDRVIILTEGKAIYNGPTN